MGKKKDRGGMIAERIKVRPHSRLKEAVGGDWDERSLDAGGKKKDEGTYGFHFAGTAGRRKEVTTTTSI